MASSDDEMEELPESVTNYYFVDDAEEPISFSVLPISWNTSETIQGSEKQIYVRGNADGGLDKIYKPVRAWKFDISGVKSEISVLSKDNWIKLQKPRQAYEEFIRTVLITVNFLHVVQKKPELSGKRIWEKLSKIFGLYDVIPSPKDLVSHRSLIEQAAKQNESLKKSKYLITVLERKSQKKHEADEDGLAQEKSEFVVSDSGYSSDDIENDSGDEQDGSDGEQEGSADEEDGEDEPFDSVCSICDEGGPLLCCEGSCMRSFHATPRSGKPSKCSSLGFTEKEVQAMPYFKCQNCKYKLHQCFSCGQLGSSDKEKGVEVFQCVNATCGYFYHPHCVAKRLHGSNEDAAKELMEKIRAGESFTCPLHICIACKHTEDKTDPKLQMAVCRRCPRAYHRKCLPRKIALEEDADEDSGILQRAWEGLLVDRILMYCLKHEINDDLGTPARDHIKFRPDVKKVKESSAGDLKEDKVATKKKVLSSRASQPPPSLESRKRTFEDSITKTDRKVPKLEKSNSSRNLPSDKKSVLTKIDGASGVEEHKYSQQFDVVRPFKAEKLEIESTKTSKSAVEQIMQQLDSDSERRILDLMNEASSVITMDDIIAKHEKLITCRSYKQRMDPCRSITLGKVDKYCEAVLAALKKIDGGYKEDAKNICEPSVLNQLVKWKSKLRVYLAPFIYGMRYTSFGRHFTTVEKLKEIVDIMHWYVNDDDTIVDFCCGANDFSWIMKQKLESRGKKCNYKNYDLFRPKNDFCFEKRDWMGVQPSELPTGTKLIMGLNPPFGVKACLANQFINKALSFKPKLLILIAPPETERLDKKHTAYDLVWENKDQLAGKAFYLPGSIDINDKQMEDWNIVAPFLYLWSRPDWTNKHKEIAKKYDHLLGEYKQNNSASRLGRDLSFKNHGQSSTPMNIDHASPQTNPPESLKEKTVGGNEDPKERFASKDHPVGRQVNATPGNNRSRKNAKKKRRNATMHVAGGSSVYSQDQKRRRSSQDIPYEVHHHSPHGTRDGREPHNFRHHLGSPPNFEPAHRGESRFSVENKHSSRYLNAPSNVQIGDPVPNHDHPATPNYGTRTYEDPYHGDTTSNYLPQDDQYPSRRERWSEDASPLPVYPHPHPVGSTLAYMRPDHSYGINQSYSEGVEQRFTAPSYLTESSAHNDRVNPMSAMDKYNIRLDEPSHPRMGHGGYGHGPPDLGPRSVGASFYHHPQPLRQGYPGIPMDFAPGPANPFLPHGSSGGWIYD